MAKTKLTPQEEINAIRSKLKHYRLEWKPKYFLDTGSPRLNSVFGIRDKGIPAGTIIEISGPESNGKTATSLDLVAIGQAAGWGALWYDAEHSFGNVWAAKRGVDTDNLALVQPYEGYFGKRPKLDKKGRPVNAATIAPTEILCDECEYWIKKKHHENRDRPIIFVVDSVTALLTRYEMEGKIDDANMRSKMSLSIFLSGLLKRWVGLFQTHNVIGIFINQLRVNPGQMFGNPETTPGGKALKFYAHVRVRVGRKGESKSRIMQSGTQIGIQGIIKNKKNKVGGIENQTCGYKLFFNGDSKFCNADLIAKGTNDE